MPSKKEKNDKSDWLIKSYNNADFLNSPQARIIRVLAEMVKPASRFQKHRLWDTVVFFGSARTLPENIARKNLREIEQKMKAARTPSVQLQSEHERAMRVRGGSFRRSEAEADAEVESRWIQRAGDERPLQSLARGFREARGGSRSAIQLGDEPRF